MGISSTLTHKCDKCGDEQTWTTNFTTATMAVPKARVVNMIGSFYFCDQCYAELLGIINESIHELET